MENIILEEFWLEPILLQAFQKLYENDSYLIEHSEKIFQDKMNTGYTNGKKKTYVSERGIVFRFGIYLQELAFYNERLSNYNIDIEYNRNIDDVKELDSKNICPDLIIHNRGTHKNNLLVIEFKTHWNSDCSDDISRLQKFIKPPYSYENALSVTIDKFEPTLNWIKPKKP